MYYEHLGQIFWKSENYLFHAFASLKNVLFVKAQWDPWIKGRQTFYKQFLMQEMFGSQTS